MSQKIFMVLLIFYLSPVLSKTELKDDIIDCVNLHTRNHCIEILTENKRAEADSNESMLCRYVGDPIIIKMKNQCGTYCYASITCEGAHARYSDQKFSAGAFCNTSNQHSCPSPIDCYSQNRATNPQIREVARVAIKNVTSTIQDQGSKNIESIEHTPNFDEAHPSLKVNDRAMHHSTAVSQAEYFNRREKEFEENIAKEIAEKAEVAQNTSSSSVSPQTRNNNSFSNVRQKIKNTAGRIFGGLSNFFKCLFTTKKCDNPSSSSTKTSSGRTWMDDR